MRNFDIDAFALALIDPSAWEALYGIPGNVNRLGVSDCNNDGLLNNFDVDCWVDRFPPAVGFCSAGYEEESVSGPAADGSAFDVAHFEEVIAMVRDHVNMDR